MEKWKTKSVYEIAVYSEVSFFQRFGSISIVFYGILVEQDNSTSRLTEKYSYQYVKPTFNL
jgi:hypothetical protein